MYLCPHWNDRSGQKIIFISDPGISDFQLVPGRPCSYQSSLNWGAAIYFSFSTMANFISVIFIDGITWATSPLQSVFWSRDASKSSKLPACHTLWLLSAQDNDRTKKKKIWLGGGLEVLKSMICKIWPILLGKAPKVVLAVRRRYLNSLWLSFPNWNHTGRQERNSWMETTGSMHRSFSFCLLHRTMPASSISSWILLSF